MVLLAVRKDGRERRQRRQADAVVDDEVRVGHERRQRQVSRDFAHPIRAEPLGNDGVDDGRIRGIEQIHQVAADALRKGPRHLTHCARVQEDGRVLGLRLLKRNARSRAVLL